MFNSVILDETILRDNSPGNVCKVKEDQGGAGDLSASLVKGGVDSLLDSSIPDPSACVPSSLQFPDPSLSISPHRRRSMTVPIEVNLCPSATSDTESPKEPSKDSATLPPRRPKKFVVSKISEEALRDGGALIIPGRSSAGSSLTGSPEISRARSPLLSPEEKMAAEVAVPKPPTLTSASRTSSMSRGSLSRRASKDLPEPVVSPTSSSPQPEHEPYITLGVCAMAKKAKSKYMTEILRRISQEFDQIRTLVFDEQQIVHDPVEKWPVVDALISFQSERFPLEKALQYSELRKPFLVNDLKMQFIIKDRRKVYELLKAQGIDVPRYAVLDRESGNPDDARIEEFEDYIIVNGMTFNKPFVEKPLCADDHNVYIYYPMSAGGGSQRLFRKIGSRSSMYSTESKVRKVGSFIYEEFMPTDGTDVKVYTVGPEYAHAEARKAPALDGVVERDREGKEIRFPVILNNIEKLISRRVCLAFKQTVCGFDLLRANGRSYVCDVNGFSFVKNSMIYYNDCAKIVANNILRRLAPQLHIPWSMPYQLEDPPIVTTTQGKQMELRCVVAIIRHGDRTPKQKMKMEMRHPLFFTLYEKFGGKFDADGGEIKLKKPNQLQEILDTVRTLLVDHRGDVEVREKRVKLEQLKAVLEMYGHFSGINRKIQIRYQPLDRLDSPVKGESPLTHEESSKDPSNAGMPTGTLVLIMKWGGELTPLGKYQSEQLGQMFRCMYPGSGEGSRLKGHGLLRLHSTFRHDLKIYASDEGRVQTTAAAFAKGLLALEGELTPILVQMVKSADTNGLLDNDLDARENENAVKKRLKAILRQDREFNESDQETLNPTNSVAIKLAMDAIKNPVKACEEMYGYIRELNVSIRDKALNTEAELPALYSSESWDLMQRRWSKLEKDFRHRDGSFDITKIPDIYDCIKFDMHHNQWISRFPCAKKMFALAHNLANIVVPLEYGITVKEKLAIAMGVATPLLRKIRADLQHVVDYQDDPENVNRLHPRFSQNVASPSRLVRSRLYFTSESHIHSLVNILRFGGLIAADDEQWSRAMKYISTVSEFNFLTQIVIMMYEDPSKDFTSDERFHIELHFSPGMIIRGSDSETTVAPAATPTIQVDKENDKNLSKLNISTSTLKNENGISDLTHHRKLSQATSMSHLADGWLDTLDANATINFPKTRYDRTVFKADSGVVMNRMFSTAVIKGISSGSSLDKIEGTSDSSDVKCLHVPNVNSLETLHNALSFHQLDEFLKQITEATNAKQISAVTSPVQTPDPALTKSVSVSETDESTNRFYVHQESLTADLQNIENQLLARELTKGILGVTLRPPTPQNTISVTETPPSSPTDGLSTGNTRASLSSSPVIGSLIYSPFKEDTISDDVDNPTSNHVVRDLKFDLDKMKE